MLNFFRELLTNFSIIMYLAKVDLVKEYRGSALGWFWAIFRPAFTIFVYYFTFIIGLKGSKIIFEAPYFLWLISGIVPWFFIRDIFQNGIASIRKYDYLVTKIKLPLSIIPVFSVFSTFLVHLILVGILLIVFLISKFGFSIYILQLPIYMLFMLLFFTFLCLLLSLLSAISKDFCNLIKSFTFALFWLSGIIWDISLLGIQWLKYLLYFNPVTFIVNGYRNCFIKHTWIWDEPIALVCFLLELTLIIFLSIFVYNKVKKDIPDLL